jgi:hypothetical protein
MELVDLRWIRRRSTGCTRFSQAGGAGNTPPVSPPQGNPGGMATADNKLAEVEEQERQDQIIHLLQLEQEEQV